MFGHDVGVMINLIIIFDRSYNSNYQYHKSQNLNLHIFTALHLVEVADIQLLRSKSRLG